MPPAHPRCRQVGANGAVPHRAFPGLCSHAGARRGAPPSSPVVQGPSARDGLGKAASFACGNGGVPALGSLKGLAGRQTCRPRSQPCRTLARTSTRESEPSLIVRRSASGLISAGSSPSTLARVRKDPSSASRRQSPPPARPKDGASDSARTSARPMSRPSGQPLAQELGEARPWGKRVVSDAREGSRRRSPAFRAGIGSAFEGAGSATPRPMSARPGNPH